MAFMMPVVKNDWDIYKSNRANRNRRTSECSHTNSCRSRKASECKSEGPNSPDFITSPQHHRSVPDKMSSSTSRQYTRSNSNSSQSASASPPKNNSSTSLNKFHNRLLDKLKKTMKSGKDEERTSS